MAIDRRRVYAEVDFPSRPRVVEATVLTLTAKHRTSIDRTLAPLLGEEEAEALLAEYPARDLDEPVTREFLRAEFAELRAEMNDRFRQQIIWMSGLMTTLVGVVALVS